MNLTISESSHCLLVVAHPDDELSSSSLLSLLVQNKCTVSCVTLTNGGTARESEGRSSLSILLGSAYNRGIIEYATWPDKHLQSAIPEAADYLSKMIAKLNPQFIVTHDPEDSHGDHQAAHSAVEIASRYSAISHITFGGPSTHPDKFRANLFLPLNSEAMQRKLSAAHMHRSQRHRPHMQTAFITGSAMTWKYQHTFLSGRSERFYEAYRILRLEISPES